MKRNTTEIKRLYNKGQHHKANYLANCALALASDYGTTKDVMTACLRRKTPSKTITQEQLDEALERYEYSKKQYYLYCRYSPKALRGQFAISDYKLKAIVHGNSEPDDPVRRFLTMRLVG